MITTTVPADELFRHIDDPDWVVFDCRFTLTDPGAGRRAWEQDHIPGARYAHLDDDLSSPVGPTSGRHPLPDADKLAARLGEWGVGAGKQVVVYDDSFGAMAVRMWWLLRWLGHDAVALLDGGYPAWKRARLPVTAEAPSIVPCRFEARPRREMWVDAAEVARALAAGEPVIDARPEMRFTGHVEPLDKVAGHIPGSVNWPFEENLDMDGTLAPADELRDAYVQLIGTTPPQRVIHSCGSGVTACHNLLAMEIAGLPGSRLYVGSWSEWIADPSRPVATGEA